MPCQSCMFLFLQMVQFHLYDGKLFTYKDQCKALLVVKLQLFQSIASYSQPLCVLFQVHSASESYSLVTRRSHCSTMMSSPNVLRHSRFHSACRQMALMIMTSDSTLKSLIHSEPLKWRSLDPLPRSCRNLKVRELPWVYNGTEHKSW